MTAEISPLSSRFTLALITLGCLVCSAHAQATFTNFTFPGQDPWVTYDDTSGTRTYYYSEASSSSCAASICIRTATTITGLASAQSIPVWNAPQNSPNSFDIWAPELHKIGGVWYIYYAAERCYSCGSQRLFVLQANQSDPVNGVDSLSSYSEGATGAQEGHGQLDDSTGGYAYDPDVFTAADGKLYIDLHP